MNVFLIIFCLILYILLKFNLNIVISDIYFDNYNIQIHLKNDVKLKNIIR